MISIFNTTNWIAQSSICRLRIFFYKCITLSSNLNCIEYCFVCLRCQAFAFGIATCFNHSYTHVGPCYFIITNQLVFRITTECCFSCTTQAKHKIGCASVCKCSAVHGQYIKLGQFKTYNTKHTFFDFT